MAVKADIQMRGHIIDSLTLAKVIDLITNSGSSYSISELQIGRYKTDQSSAKITINSESYEVMNNVVSMASKHGATLTKELANV